MKKLLALILALVLALAPVSAFASDADQTTYFVSVYTGTVTNQSDPAYELEVQGAEGMTGTEVLRAALEQAEIPHVIETTEYGNYLSSLDGIAELEHGKLSGWLCAINGDRFSNMGLDTVLEPESVLEVHYSVTGGEDVGATWGSESILTKLSLGRTTVKLRKETDDTTYTTSYFLGGKPMEGSGSEDDPFVIRMTLPYGSDLEHLTLSWESSLHPCYAELVGEETEDFSEPVTLVLLSATGGETYYTVEASLKAPSGGGGGGGVSRAPEKETKPLEIAPYLKDLTLSGFGSEWAAIALARGGAELPQSAWDAYFASVCKTVAEANGVLSDRKYTEYSRTVLALSALGVDPKQVAGFDLTAPLSNKEAVLRQGINGAIWARLALKTVGQDAYLDEILAAQNKDGGWSLSGENSDADLTAMALVALRNSGKTQALDAGMKFLEKVKCTSCESVAQVLIARAAQGRSCDPAELLAYRTKDGFSHEIGGETNPMATEQAVLALVAVSRAENDLPFLYDMSGEERKVCSFYDGIDHANQTAIESLGKRGLITGFPDGRFLPDATMTRAEFCALLCRALNLSGGTCDFPDVSKEAWYYDAVCAATASGIVKGRTDGRFDAAASITVHEAHLMVARAAEYLNVEWETASEESRAVLRCEVAQMIYDLLEMTHA
ncbi:MAG: S-layer homology domain-containing protein [Oscillospiraceae bacterium]|nr:S-layer homology domain-containing protein [Oscillospiraceae bacterium]